MNIYLDVQSPAVKEAGTLASAYGLANHGLVNLRRAYWNLPTPALYEESIFRSEGSLSHLGPLVVNTGKHTARAAADKFVVREQSTEEKIWWGQPPHPHHYAKGVAQFVCAHHVPEDSGSRRTPAAYARIHRNSGALVSGLAHGGRHAYGNLHRY